MSKKSEQYLETAKTIDKNNRQLLTTDDFILWLFSEGTKQADIWFSQILPYAQTAGYKTIFKETFIKKRAIIVREEFGLNACNPLGNSILAFTDYREYSIPAGYIMDEVKGISKFDTQTLEYKEIFPHPIIITGRYINVNTKEHSVKALYYDNGVIGEFFVNLFTISNANQIQTLTKNGVRVTSESAKFLVGFLSHFISINIVKIPIIKSTSILGWVNNEFLPYTDNVEFEGNDYAKKILSAVRCEGDYPKWKKLVKESCRNDFVRVSMASSFASPLLQHTKKPIFITHLWGTSGTAKTVALYLALSVWGQPKSMSCQWNATVVASEQKAIILNNIPMSMNESELLNGARSTFQNYSDFIYMYCEGESKPRGAKDGGLQIGGNWNSCCLSNGEGSLITDKSKEGELNRVLEFQTDIKLFNTEEKAIEVANFCKENFGYAGKEFTDNCLKYDLIDKWNEFFKITQAHGTGKQAGAMASLLLGDLLMQVIIYGVSENKAMESTFEFFHRIKSSMKTGLDIDISARAKDYFDGWLAQNINNFVGGGSDREPNQIYGAIKNNVIYVINSVFVEAMAKQGFNIAKIHKDFKERDFFARTGGDKPTVTQRIKGAVTRCYAFNFDDVPDEFLE